MNFYYFDTSALAEQYVKEPGSTWVRELIARTNSEGKPLNAILTAEISIVETAAALAIVSRIGKISLRDRDIAYQQFMRDAAHLYHLVPVKTSDFHTAARLTQQYPLKAYGAVQLAVALRQHRALARRRIALIFVSGDQQQLRAADAEGLDVDNPFDHLSPSDSLTPM